MLQEMRQKVRAMCQEMAMDHAFINPMRLFWPNENPPKIKTIPVAINTVQFPLPRPARCFALGKAIAKEAPARERQQVRTYVSPWRGYVRT